MESAIDREVRELWVELEPLADEGQFSMLTGAFDKWSHRFGAASTHARLSLLERTVQAAVTTRMECEAIIQSGRFRGAVGPCFYRNSVFGSVVEACFVPGFPWTEDAVSAVLRWWHEGFPVYCYRTRVAKLMIRSFGSADLLKSARVQEWLRQAADEERRAHKPDQHWLRKVDALLGQETRLALTPGEVWSDAMLADLAARPAKVQRAWNELLLHMATAQGSSPSSTWIRTAHRLAESIQRDEIVSRFEAWFALVEKPRTTAFVRSQGRASEEGSFELTDAGQDVIKGFCWLAGTLDESRLTRALGRLVLTSLRKIPNRGPRAVKVGNAAIQALGNMTAPDALGQLAMLRVKVKFQASVKVIEKALTKAADRAGITREDVDELGVPTYGFTGVGERFETLENGTLRLVLRTSGKTELGFLSSQGKTTKTIPVAIKTAHAELLTEIKSAGKDAAAMLSAQRSRLDGLFLQAKIWSFSVWRERYLEHPIVGILARNLIWNISGVDGRTHAVVHRSGRGFVDANDQPVRLEAEGATVRLWHPIEAELRDVLAWRAYFEDQGLVQPFKQAHREIYVLTDAERTTRTYSNRFAAHVLRQHQFHALCSARNWRNKLRLLVDDSFPPATRHLPAHALRAEYWIEGLGEEYGQDTNEVGVFHLLSTDQVRFYALDAATHSSPPTGGGYEADRRGQPPADPLPLESIPPLVLSEILRDVDLFVGVASVGANPYWQDGGPEGRYRNYWWEFSFGELTSLGAGRRELLQRIIPRLSIASACSFDERHLIVQGKLRRYRIHLGSGNILMDPDDRYLCIVAKASDMLGLGSIQLPFEGDRTLSIVLSKAMLLADDDKITDPTILCQIRT